MNIIVGYIVTPMLSVGIVSITFRKLLTVLALFEVLNSCLGQGCFLGKFRNEKIKAYTNIFEKLNFYKKTLKKNLNKNINGISVLISNHFQTKSFTDSKNTANLLYRTIELYF